MNLGGAIEHLLPKRELTADERADIETVLDAAAAWEAGKLPAHEVSALGWIAFDPGSGATPSPGYTRFLAVRLTPLTDPRRVALERWVDAWVRESFSDVVLTRQGAFLKNELGERGVVVKARAA